MKFVLVAFLLCGCAARMPDKPGIALCIEGGTHDEFKLVRKDLCKDEGEYWRCP